uniref:Ovule protein n=1 Tax=Heterorhabditis bacteriophora TaxID=37862 RepID=A0A1I7XPV0_HETBA
MSASPMLQHMYSLDDSSNCHFCQISMNWMRMNGLGQGSVRPLMTGSTSHTPKASQSTTHLGRVCSLRKMHVSSLEDKIPRSGTQCEVACDVLEQIVILIQTKEQLFLCKVVPSSQPHSIYVLFGFI